MNRADAYGLLTEYTKSPSLIKHMLAVEAAMRAYARQLGQDEERWGIVGLLHDFDYEKFPDQHPMAGKPILEQRGVAEEIVYAIQCHADFTGYNGKTASVDAPATVDGCGPSGNVGSKCKKAKKKKRKHHAAEAKKKHKKKSCKKKKRKKHRK